MTELLHQTDAYLKTFEARVVDVDEEHHALTLDRTAFFPGGGGQPHDTGQLILDGKELAVAKVFGSGKEVLHVIDGGQPLPQPGTSVEGRIDWDRRYALMRTHTALHVLCGVVYRDHGALVTGGSMEPLRGRMDFEFASMRADLVRGIEEACNAEVERGRDVVVSILPRDEAERIPTLIRTKVNLLPAGITEIRVVDIEGLDLQADGGTHVANTSEVGPLRITDYKSKGKINKRIYLALDG
jgi:misacylated tRNA(Ala) deacylase